MSTTTETTDIKSERLSVPPPPFDTQEDVDYFIKYETIQRAVERDEYNSTYYSYNSFKRLI